MEPPPGHYEDVNDYAPSTRFSFLTPHADQPRSRLSQGYTDADLSYVLDSIPFWTAVEGALKPCRFVIFHSVDLSRSKIGQEWLRIIDSRMKALNEARGGLVAAMERKRDGVDDQHLRRECRRQEDRLRRLRGDVLFEIAKRPELAGEKYADGKTYDERVTEVLRDTYRRCARAKEKFCCEVEDAQAKGSQA